MKKDNSIMVIKFLSFSTLFFCTLINSENKNFPEPIKYFMWFCSGITFVGFIVEMFRNEKDTENEKDNKNDRDNKGNSVN